jgi:hypothetical protein
MHQMAKETKEKKEKTFAIGSGFHYLPQKITLLEDSRQHQRAEDWVNHLPAKGKYAFALHRFRADFPWQSDTANKFALKRLVDKEQIISIHKGYYLIIPPQYRSKGILPSTLFLDAFMKELNRPYYLALLNAAAYHKGFCIRRKMESNRKHTH